MNLSNHEHYLELQVNDLDTWVKFYTNQLGFEPLNIEEFTVLLSNGYTVLKLWKDATR
jgi:catechol-2,3-dioxygenase